MNSRHRTSLLSVIRIGVASLLLASCAGMEPRILGSSETVAVALVEEAASSSQLDSPDSKSWKGIPEYGVLLQPAPPVHPSIVLRQAPASASRNAAPIYFRVARDTERLWIRLRWQDDTRNAENEFEHFPDAVAIQFALQEASQTSFMMGTPDGPVNIWHWKANGDRAENLAAGGFGSLTRLTRQNVSALSEYENGKSREWSVVFSRPLETMERYEANFVPGASVPIAFAVWQGAEGQRDGHKLATVGWLELQFGDSE